MSTSRVRAEAVGAGTPDAALAAVVRAVVTDGVAALAGVLDAVGQALGATLTLTLSGPREGAGAVPPPRFGTGRRIDVPVRVAGVGRGLLTATSARPLTAAAGATLVAVADVIGLGCAAADARRAAARAVLDAEADRAQALAAFTGGTGAALGTARFAADVLAAGAADPAALAEPVRAADEAFRGQRRSLRAHALESGLRAALREVARAAGDGLDDGEPALDVRVSATDPRLDRLDPAVAVTAQRVTEAAIRGATGSARVRAEIDESVLKLSVSCADTAYDASELDRWARRAQALGGTLRVDPDSVELTLPNPVPRREGNHDHRPHL